MLDENEKRPIRTTASDGAFFLIVVAELASSRLLSLLVSSAKYLDDVAGRVIG